MTFSVPSRDKRGEVAYLLKNVSAFLLPGELCALMVRRVSQRYSLSGMAFHKPAASHA